MAGQRRKSDAARYITIGAAPDLSKRRDLTVLEPAYVPVIGAIEINGNATLIRAGSISSRGQAAVSQWKR